MEVYVSEGRKELREIIVSFYNNEYYLIPNEYCTYDLYRIRIFLRLVKGKLPYTVFIECLVDYLASIVKIGEKESCFNHLRHYDCLRYDVCPREKINVK